MNVNMVMECEKCGVEFVPPKSLMKNFTMCPFCGTVLFNAEIARSYIQIVEFLQYIVSVYGIDIYVDREKLKGLIHDFYIGDKRIKRICIRAIVDDAVAEKIYKIFFKTQDEQERCFDKIVSYFSESNFCEKNVSIQIIDGFAKGLFLSIKEEDRKDLKNLPEKKNWKLECRIASYYFAGIIVNQSTVEAVKWYRRLADQGFIYAQYQLGEHYFYGGGVKQSYTEAVRWYRISANQGDLSAQFRLGMCYFYGQGVEQSYTEAVKWYRKASEKPMAAAMLSYCYANGKGVERSRVEAYNWSRRGLCKEEVDRRIQWMQKNYLNR